MSLLRLDLDLYDSQATVDAQLLQSKGGRALILDQIAEYLDRLVNGSSNMNSGRLVTGAVKASGTVTMSSFAAADTVTINGVVFTASASPSGNQQFLSTGGDTAVAAALTAKINAAGAPAKVLNVVTATSVGAVITVTCLVPGLIGNLCGLAISAHGSVSGALLTGGAEASITAIPA